MVRTCGASQDSLVCKTCVNVCLRSSHFGNVNRTRGHGAECWVHSMGEIKILMVAYITYTDMVNKPGESTVVSVGYDNLLRAVDSDFAAAPEKEEIVSAELK